MFDKIMGYVVGALCSVGVGIITVSLVAPSPAHAIGCLSGGALGAVGGHVAGHHAVLGAVGGCVVGHYMNKNQKQRDQSNYNRGYTASPNYNGGYPTR